MLFPLVAVYPFLISVLRFRRIEAVKKKYAYSTRERMAKMTDNEAHEILNIISDLEFPAMFEKGLQLALFRTYGIPSISELLVKTTQLTAAENVGKRYADTTVLIAEIYGNPPADARALEAFGRLNYLHGLYIKQGRISNDDMLYTLSLFMLEPPRMIAKTEWRCLTDLEICALAVFHKSMGDAMQISFDVLPSAKTGFRDGLAFYTELEEWSIDYEKRSMVPHQNNYITAIQTQNLLLKNIPRPLHAAVSNIISAAMDDRLRAAIKFDKPSPFYRGLLDSFLTARKFYLRYLALPRPKFMVNHLVEKIADADGRRHFTRYDTLPYYVKPTLYNRWGLGAIASRLMGVPVPGDEGFCPEGFMTSDAGPAALMGKGRLEAEGTKKRLAKERTGGCPFVTLR